MTSRERVLAAIAHQPVDRLPSDIWATPEIWQMLRGHFGVETEDQVRDCLGIDGLIFHTAPSTRARPLSPEGTPTDIWGSWGREMRLPSGGLYWEQAHYPLKHVTEVAELDDFDWEDPSEYDLVAARETATRLHERYVVIAGYIAPFVDLWTLFGQETALLNLALRPELIEAVLDRSQAYRLEQHRQLFEATRGLAEVANVTDDFGSQNGLVMSPGTIRSLFWPHYRAAIKLAKSFGLKVFHHDDGGMAEIIPELVEMGVDLLNPIQWRCAGMDRERMKAEFGDRLCFHGAVDTQAVMAFGTPEDVRQEVRDNLRMLGGDGTGYIIAPCHNIQSGSPLDNVLAMYDEIHAVTGG
jgi:uroporphyrinogen decarboxylase